jgi:histidinol-phosphate aminotransferase
MGIFLMSRYWSSLIDKLTPYIPGEQPKQQNVIKLNTNENPYPPSPMIKEAILGEMDRLRLYPDPDADILRDAISTFYEVSRENIFVGGNGSDEILAHIFHGLLKQDLPILFPEITYSFYPVYCALYDIMFEKIPLDSSFQIRLGDYIRPNGGIIFPNPNAPTGCIRPIEEIEKLLKKNPDSVVVVDEAYIDFGGESAIPLTKKYDNLLVVQTLSKSRSLAGLRVGFAIGSTQLTEALERVKNSFNSYPLDRLAIAGATASILDRNYFEKTRQKIIETREQLSKKLQDLGFFVLPSKTNFLFARHPEHDGKKLHQMLRDKGILVRHFSDPKINQFLRITIGTEKECEALTKTLSSILKAG